jgi:hypothetical protein
MGTRADFYMDRGQDAEWLGSIAWDGYPDDVELIESLHATSAEEYREAVAAMFGRRRDATLPAQGWPWPWDDSGTTDYAYAFDDGKVWASNFGSPWFDPLGAHPEGDDDAADVPFPDMSARKNVQWSGPGSGLIVVSSDAAGRISVE